MHYEYRQDPGTGEGIDGNAGRKQTMSLLPLFFDKGTAMYEDVCLVEPYEAHKNVCYCNLTLN